MGQQCSNATAANALRKVKPIPRHSSAGIDLLAKRETQVANLVVEGLATKEIAKRLHITEHTVSNYLV